MNQPTVEVPAVLTGVLWALLASPLLAVGLYLYAVVPSSASGVAPTEAVIAVAIEVGVAVSGYRGAKRTALPLLRL
jgi:hypothetical protein